MTRFAALVIASTLFSSACWARDNRHALIDPTLFHMQQTSKHQRAPNTYYKYEIPVFPALPEVNAKVRTFIDGQIATQAEEAKQAWHMFEGGRYPPSEGMMRRELTEDSEIECRSRIEQANKAFVSLLLLCERYSGATELIVYSTSINFDISTKRFLSFPDVLTKTSGAFDTVKAFLLRKIAGDLAVSCQEQRLAKIEEGLEDLRNYESFVFGPSWITLYADETITGSRGMRRISIDR